MNDYLVPLIDAKVVEMSDKSYRKHLGASVIGGNCARALWYSFFWCGKEVFEGRQLRLFARGQREEAVFVQLLRDIGATVWETHPETGKQFMVDYFGGHYGGSCDGVAVDLPGIDGPTLLEFKTHNAKSFSKLRLHGVASSKPTHYKQMQVYMRGLELQQALYMAVNKDNDELYTEVVTFDPTIGSAAEARAERLIFSRELPPKLSDRPAYFECRYCTFRNVCHGDAKVDKNCRTCEHSQPLPDGTWMCQKQKQELTLQPEVGCSAYQLCSLLT